MLYGFNNCKPDEEDFFNDNTASNRVRITESDHNNSNDGNNSKKDRG